MFHPVKLGMNICRVYLKDIHSIIICTNNFFVYCMPFAASINRCLIHKIFDRIVYVFINTRLCLIIFLLCTIIE